MHVEERDVYLWGRDVEEKREPEVSSELGSPHCPPRGDGEQGGGVLFGIPVPSARPKLHRPA